MKRKIISIFVPHQGCPNDCIFCNQEKITGVSTDMSGEKAREIIEESFRTIEGNCIVEIAFFGGSFTAIDIEKQIELLSVAKKYKDIGVVDDIRLSTRPDCIDISVLKTIKSYGVTIIELGVQSMDEEVLLKSIRGHHRDVVYKSAELIKSMGIKLGLQMMVGLPSDTEEKCIETAREFIGIGPSFVRIYPTLVIKETGLENKYLLGEYIPFSIDKSVDIVKKLLVLFKTNNIEVIRVGLQATDDIKEGVDVVGGPYHPAFRELVESRIILDYIIWVLESENILCIKRNKSNQFDKANDFIVNKQKNKSTEEIHNRNKTEINKLVIKTSNKNISRIIGMLGCNRTYIKENYGYKLITKIDNSLEKELSISIDNGNERYITFTEMYRLLMTKYNI